MPKRAIRIVGDLAYIPLTQGYEAVIDAADLSLVDGFDWTATVRKRTVYAHRKEVQNGKVQHVALHRSIMGDPVGLAVDHRDGNGLNNRRVNLRTATKSQNGCNRPRQANNNSGLKGVSWDSHRGRWLAQLCVGGKNVLFKRFGTKEDAATAYFEACSKHHGDFGRTA